MRYRGPCNERVKEYERAVRTGMMLMLLLLFVLPLKAQSAEEYRVKWIGEYPGERGEKRTSFGDRLSRIVFGQKPQDLMKPFNVVAVDQEQFWILDQGAGGVFQVAGGQGAWIRPLRRAELEYPSLVGICRMPGGDLLLTDSRLNRVLRISEGQLMIFGDSIPLDQPTGIACNRSNGEVWVVETGEHQLTRISSEGKLIEKIGGRGTGPGQYNFPTFLWIDQEGRIYVVDSMNDRIQILNQEGACLGSFGESGDATGYMARPKGIATDSKGNIYVADALFHAVQIFDSQGQFLYSFGSQGQGPGEFWMPAGLYIDEKDHIFVADTYNARVQVFQLEKEN
ncbi:MAG: 6-bladed beta-propeller [Bacteroidales bacterium]|nr:6-bladed beta-propeller [Bacteroidales bacterium]